MSEKKRRDITLGEMQEECSFRGDNCETIGGDKCKFFELCATMQTIDKGCLTPIMWNLTDPPRFNEAQMALLRMMMGMGAEYATQQNGFLSFYTAEPMRRAAVIDQRILNDGETLDLAELFGKDGAHAQT